MDQYLLELTKPLAPPAEAAAERVAIIEGAAPPASGDGAASAEADAGAADAGAEVSVVAGVSVIEAGGCHSGAAFEPFDGASLGVELRRRAAALAASEDAARGEALVCPRDAQACPYSSAP